MGSIDLGYLDDERKKLWKKVIELQDLIDKKTSDYEKESAQASRKCAEFRNRCEAANKQADIIVSNLHKTESEINQSNVVANIEEIQAFYEELSPSKDRINNKIAELDTLFASYATYAERLKNLDTLSNTADETATKVDAIFKHISLRKKEIDQVYIEVFGYTDTDTDTNEEKEVPGLKDELDLAYVNLKKDFLAFSDSSKLEIKNTLKAWDDSYQSALGKIESLLPRALTTGLSYAYSEKKSAEIDESKALAKVFIYAVLGLIIISLIPFGVSIYQLNYGMPLDEAILQMPRLVLSIVPLYVPVLWVAVSSNRKMNLSKRLIEEYTHKEVLSKTFEGLATQIQNLDDSEISTELKTRLLYNILEVSSENPGKLISDYNKSDHPLMDALDKSMKLTNSIDYLTKIPGMSKLVEVLDSKSKEIVENAADKAVTGLEKAVTDKVLRD